MQKEGKSIVIYSIAQLAEVLGISQRSAYNLIAGGNGPKHIRVGRHIRVTQKDLLEWLESQRQNDDPS